MIVAIPTDGTRPDLLRRTLDSLGRCSRPPAHRATIVVENGARRGVEEMLASCPPELRLRYRFSPPANKSAALNLVLEEVGDELVVMFDDDVRLDEGILDCYAAAATAGAGTFFGGPLGVDYEEPPAPEVRPYLPPSARGWSGEPLKYATFLGPNWAAFAADLRAAGGFDVRYGPGAPMGGQESEMQQRLVRSGCRAVYLPGARAWHYVPRARCSPQWALERNYRSFVMHGFGQPRRLAGRVVPSAVLVPYLCAAAAGATLWLYPFRRTRFRARVWQHRARGALAGVRLRIAARLAGRSALSLPP